MNKITFKLSTRMGTDISSRRESSILRQEIEKAINGSLGTNSIIQLDFEGVRTYAESAADELIGILVSIHGFVWFRVHIEIININDSQRDIIATAVLARKEFNRKNGLPFFNESLEEGEIMKSNEQKIKEWDELSEYFNRLKAPNIIPFLTC